MYTQCAHCQTLFRITAEQLKAAAGRVRCGHCAQVFNALERLVEQLPGQIEEQTEEHSEQQAEAHTPDDRASATPPAPATPPPPAADFDNTEDDGLHAAPHVEPDWGFSEPSEPASLAAPPVEATPSPPAPVSVPVDRPVNFEALDLDTVEIHTTDFDTDFRPSAPSGPDKVGTLETLGMPDTPNARPEAEPPAPEDHLARGFDSDHPSFDDLKAVFADLELPDSGSPAASAETLGTGADASRWHDADSAADIDNDDALHIDLAGPGPQHTPPARPPFVPISTTPPDTALASLSDREMSDIDVLLKQLARDVESMTATMQRRPSAKAETATVHNADAATPDPDDHRRQPDTDSVPDTGAEPESGATRSTMPESDMASDLKSAPASDQASRSDPAAESTRDSLPEPEVDQTPEHTAHPPSDPDDELAAAFRALDLPDAETAPPHDEAPDEFLIETPAASPPTGAPAHTREVQEGHTGTDAAYATADRPSAPAATGTEREHDGIPDILRSALEEAARPRRSPLATVAGAVFILILLALALAQLAYFRGPELATTFPALRPTLTHFCSLSGCHLPERRALSQLVMLNQDIRSQTRTPGALQITATIENRADFRQPWPALHISLSDLTGNLVAARLFTPAEYLAHTPEALQQWRDGMGMPIATPVNIEVDVADPGQQAINYVFSFR